MLKKLLEEEGIKTTKVEFEELMEAVAEDIKFNNIGFKKRTTYKEFLSITLRTAAVIKRCS